MEDIKNEWSVVKQAKTVRREAIEKVQEIVKLLRVLKSIREFDEGLFGILIEQTS